MTTTLIDSGCQAAGFAASDQLAARPPAFVRVEAAVAPEARQTYRFPQKLIPLDGGTTLLRLREALQLEVDRKRMEFSVEGWGIRMPCAQVEDLPRQIARRFLTLFSKADTETMSSVEKLEWLRILDLVDYTQFAIDRAAPHYTEGTLRGKTPIVIEWHDGTVEQLPGNLAAAFFPLDAGDRFSAFVKSGKDNRTLHVERVCLLS